MTDNSSANRLDEALSPYLLQHADNPVHWQPWGREALAMARTLDKPILLSVGYSACHWCHVMAHESFENERVAEIMNAHFINIKVDREERPDLDRIYQLAHQLLTGRGGGWPLTVFLDPEDQAPFFAGTYFPLKSLQGMIAFPDLLERIRQVWSTRRDELRAQNLQVQQALQAVSRPQPDDEGALDPDQASESLVAEMAARFDADNGGFGTAPKFPQAPQLAALADLAGDEQADQILVDTLEAMARRGLYDHLAGGFFRYCVDAAWEIPHFEKMLPDNAQLLGLYARSAQRWKRADFTRVCEQTVEWLASEMALAGGGYAASLDADSPDGEGAFYVWQPDQVDRVLDGNEREYFFERYGLDGPPNFEQTHWHLIVARSTGEVIRPGQDETTIRQTLDSARKKLLAARNERPRPGCDDKVIAGWNGLLIENLALAGRLLDKPEWIERAAESLDAVAVRLFGQDPPRAVWRDGKSDHPATLDDHANILNACIELLTWRFEMRWFNLARRIARRIREQFVDHGSGALYLTPVDHETLITRPLAHSDDATPSGAGQAVAGLVRLGHLTGDAASLNTAAEAVQAASGEIRRSAIGHASMIRAARLLADAEPVVLLGGPPDPVDAWHRELSARPELRCYRMNDALPPDELPERFQPLIGTGQPSAIVCLADRCLAPAHDIETVRSHLASSPDG